MQTNQREQLLEPATSKSNKCKTVTEEFDKKNDIFSLLSSIIVNDTRHAMRSTLARYKA